MIRWLWENLGTLLLALVLSFTVWVVAVNAEDPLVERPFSIPIEVRYAGLADDLTVVGDPTASVRITLRAPESVWQGFRSEDILARVALHGLGAGTYEVPVELELLRRPAHGSCPLRGRAAAPWWPPARETPARSRPSGARPACGA